MAGLPAILITHILFGATKDLCYVVLLKIILIDQQYFFSVNLECFSFIPVLPVILLQTI